jgi:hypothetical protein
LERFCDILWHVGIFGGGFLWLIESIVKDVFMERINIELEIEGYKKDNN